MNIIAEMVADWLGEQVIDSLPNYYRALKNACEEFPPPFGEKYYGDIYRGVAGYAEWLASSLIVNAAGEGDGSTRLWELASFTPDKYISDQVKQHSIDEARHARWYLVILDLTFPGATNKKFRSQLETLSPGYTLTSPPATDTTSPFAHAITIDDLIQMNIAEIRTCVHHLFQRPILLVHCSPSRHKKLIRLLDSLLSDEIKHISYTARLIEDLSAEDCGISVDELMKERLNDFNEITRNDLDNKVFELT